MAVRATKIVKMLARRLLPRKGRLMTSRQRQTAGDHEPCVKDDPRAPVPRGLTAINR